MPEVYSDDNGARVIVRHVGPAGRGFPPGGRAGQVLAKGSSEDYDATWVNPPDGTDAVSGPSASVNNHVAVFDGNTGKLLKDGGLPLSSYATISLVSTKQNAEIGKGLSSNDFTTVEKSKLASLSEHYRGTYTSTSLVESEVVSPVAGDYALVENVGSPQTVSFWDATNNAWDHQVVEQMTGQEIASALFDTQDSANYSQEACRIFTDAEKTQLAEIQSLVDSLELGDVSKAYGVISAFSTPSLPFPNTDITGITDGATNLVVANVSTGAVLGAASTSFDNGGVSTGRLRYTGASTKKFIVNACVDIISSLSSGSLMAVIAKNGTIIPESRQRVVFVHNTGSVTIFMTALVELLTNQYVEIFVGNFSGTEDINVSSLTISAHSV